MKKKIISLIIICALSATCFCGCTKASQNNQAISDIKKAQKLFSSNNSCHIVTTAKVTTPQKTDSNLINFSFKTTKNGVFEYCTSQQDASSKLVSCEFCDGEKAEQWLIGKGWSVMQPISYTHENPHNLILLLTKPIDKNCVEKAVITTEGENQKYLLNMDEKALTNALPADSTYEISSQEVSFLIDKAGNILCYNDDATIVDKASKKSSQYFLEMQLSEHNSVAEILKPEVRVNAIANQVEIDEGK